MFPSIAMTIGCLILYFKQVSFIKQYFGKDVISSYNIQLKKLMIYPVLLGICLSPAWLSLFINNFGESMVNNLYKIIYSSMGCINTLVYYFVRNALLNHEYRKPVGDN